MTASSSLSLSSPSASRQHDNAKRIKKLKRSFFLRKKQAKSAVVATNGKATQTRNNPRRSCPLLERGKGNRHLYCDFGIDEIYDNEHAKIEAASTKCNSTGNNDVMFDNANDNKEKKIDEDKDPKYEEDDFNLQESLSRDLSPQRKQNDPHFENDAFHKTSFGVRKRRGDKDPREVNDMTNHCSVVTKECASNAKEEYQTVGIMCKFDQLSLSQSEEKPNEYKEDNNRVPSLTITVSSASAAPSAVALESSIIDEIPLDSAIGAMRIIQDTNDVNEDDYGGSDREAEEIEIENLREEDGDFTRTITQHNTAATRQTMVGAFHVPGINSQDTIPSRRGTIVYQMGDNISNIEDDNDSINSNHGFLVEAQVVDLESEKEELKERIISEISSKIKDEMISAREEERKLAHNRIVAKRAIARWKGGKNEKCKGRKINHRLEKKVCGLVVTVSLVAFVTWMMLE